MHENFPGDGNGGILTAHASGRQLETSAPTQPDYNYVDIKLNIQYHKNLKATNYLNLQWYIHLMYRHDRSTQIQKLETVMTSGMSGSVILN